MQNLVKRSYVTLFQEPFLTQWAKHQQEENFERFEAVLNVAIELTNSYQ